MSIPSIPINLRARSEVSGEVIQPLGIGTTLPFLSLFCPFLRLLSPPPLPFNLLCPLHFLLRQAGVIQLVQLHAGEIRHTRMLNEPTLSRSIFRAIALFWDKERVCWQVTRMPVGLCSNCTLFSVLLIDCPPGPLPLKW